MSYAVGGKKKEAKAYAKISDDDPEAALSNPLIAPANKNLSKQIENKLGSIQ